MTEESFAAQTPRGWHGPGRLGEELRPLLCQSEQSKNIVLSRTGEGPMTGERALIGVISIFWILARGSRIARGFAIFLSLGCLAGVLAFTIGQIDGGAPGYLAYLIAAALALPFLFSTWALLFHRDLREALGQRSEKWTAAEKTRLQELEI